jgi:hypothetical protein
MSRSKRILLVAFLVICVVAVWPRRSPPSAPTAPAAPSTAVSQPIPAGTLSAPPPSAAHPEAHSTPNPAAAAAQPPAPALLPPAPAGAMAPATAVEAVRGAIEKCGAAFGGNPVGTNAEITRALTGNNPTHANFLNGIPGQRIDSSGELVDPWGTPYFFHQLSGRDMEVRSAGPDRIMWTGDDVILK